MIDAQCVVAVNGVDQRSGSHSTTVSLDGAAGHELLKVV